MPHIHYAIDNTVEVFVVKNNNVLLRKHDKYGIWLSVGGHIELNEDPNEAAKREVKEEVGLDIELVPTTRLLDIENESYGHLIPPAFINRHKINENHEHVTLVYFAKPKNENIVENEKEKSGGIKWLSWEDLENSSEIKDTVKEYAKEALKFVEGKDN